MSVLNKPENLQKGLTFDELRNVLTALPEGERVGSPNTLSKVLKTLVQRGIITRDIETRKYRVHESMPQALTDELGRRSLATSISGSEEFIVFHDMKFERGVMHGFMDRHTGGAGSNATTWESPYMFDSMLGHITRGVLDYSRGRGLLDETYFERKRDPQDITDNQLDVMWRELNLHHRKMILTYEVDSEQLLKFLKSNDGKLFLKKAFEEFSKRQKPFHQELDFMLYIDRIMQNRRVRAAIPLRMKFEPSKDVTESKGVNND